MAMRKIELLLEISNIILDAESMEDVLTRTVTHLRRGLGSDVCSVYLLSKFKKDTLTLMATDGLSPSAVGNVTMKTSEGLTGLSFTSGEYTFIRNATKHPGFNYFPGINEEPFHTYIGVPLKGRSHTIGVLVFQFQKDKKNTDAMKALIKAAAAQVSTIMMKHYLYEPHNDDDMYEGEISIRGIPLSGGIAIGSPAMVLSRFVEKNTGVLDVVLELSELENAFLKTKADLIKLIDDLDKNGDSIDSEIFQTHLLMLEDSMFREDIKRHVSEHRKSAAFSVRHVADKVIKRFMSIPDRYLRERAGDIEDISKRLLSHLGVMKRDVELGENSILIADALTPGETASLDLEKVTGFITSKDGATSHTAILAKSRHIPAVSGVKKLSEFMEVAETIILDGDSGEIFINPTPERLKEYIEKINNIKQKPDLGEADPNIILPDGERVYFYANVSSLLDAERARSLKADGIGLVRTEIFYLQNPAGFGFGEQVKTYEEILSMFPGDVVFRLFDIGADKKSNLEIPEDNPALGNRGIRLLLDSKRMLEEQLRALIEVYSSYPSLKIMVPFVSTPEELRDVVLLGRQIAEERGVKAPSFGTMIEIPSAVFYIEELAEYCDFFSIGSNDLFQYFFAVDRTNPAVSSLYPTNNKAFLALLEHIYQRVAKTGRKLEICGEIAADERILSHLIKTGYRIFSLNPYVINDLRHFVRNTLC
jgi:phosphotransferase system enzyme I (PtsP)